MRPVAVLAGAAVSIAAASQYHKFLVDSPGVWKPWKGFTAIASARKEQAAAPALVKAFEAELLALNEIARRASGFGAPRSQRLAGISRTCVYRQPGTAR